MMHFNRRKENPPTLRQIHDEHWHCVCVTEISATDRAIASAMAALGSPIRVALLRELRSPKTITEIEVRSGGGGRMKPLSRQAMRGHLDRLLELSVVQRRSAQRDFGEAREYMLNHQTLYAMAEMLRATARLRSLEEPSVPTSPAQPSAAVTRPTYCFVMVKGLDEGSVFELVPRGGFSEWFVGRRRGLHVSLDFDPYVSSENTRVRWESGAHFITDVSGSKNGTSVNFRRLQPNEAVKLEHGDVVGVGRTVLVYWSKPEG